MVTLRKTTLALVLATAIFQACKTGPDPGQEATVPGSDSGIFLTQEQLKNGEILFGKIERKLLSFDIRAKGQLTLPPGQKATVSSMVGGLITDIPVRLGTHVTPGQKLASLSSPEIIQVQEDYATATNRFRVLEADYLRQKELASDGIASTKKLQEAEAAYMEVKITREALKGRLQQLNLPVDSIPAARFARTAPLNSPIEGDVELIGAALGAWASPGDVLFTMVNRNRLQIELAVFEKDISYISPGQRVTFRLSNLDDIQYEARVVNVGRTVEENARTVRVIADFINTSPHVLPGMFVAAEIHTAEQETDALPEEAVIADRDGSYCFYSMGAEKGGTRFFRLPVRTGFREENSVQVQPLAPLPTEAKIVVSGTYFIRAEGLKAAE